MLPSSTKWLIESLFFTIPTSLLPLLSPNARMDMVDLFHAGQKAEVVNRLGGVTTMLSATPQHLDLQLTEGSRWEVFLLPDTTLQVTQTFYAIDTMKVVQCYSSTWRRLPSTIGQKESRTSYGK